MTRLPFLAAALAVLLQAGTVRAGAPPAPGLYNVAEGPDVAGQMVLEGDGQFDYWLIAGALEEHSTGIWEAKDGQICLVTEPKPVQPEFVRNEEPAGEEDPTILVTSPDGEGIPGVDFLLHFANGEELEGYTQYYGWSLAGDDTRQPEWATFSVPMYRIASQQIAFRPKDGGRLRVKLVPNDLGLIDLTGACLEQTGEGFVLLRNDGVLRFTRAEP